MRKRRHIGPKDTARMGRRLVLLGGVLAMPLACVFDANDRCGDNQHMADDDKSCICDDGTAWTPTGCVPCGENEVPGAAGCECAMGYARAEPDSSCEEVPQGLGVECTEESPCGGDYDHCEPVEGAPGYCTTTGCAAPEDCENGYACDTEVSPTVCRRPPAGLGQACADASECAGTEATYCDMFSGTCAIEGCSLTTDDCFVGLECCDLSEFGVPNPLCIPEGACTSS